MADRRRRHHGRPQAPRSAACSQGLGPDSRLRFGEAAELWLAGPVQDLRATTQAGHRTAVEQHLLRRFGKSRIDGVTADDLAALVRDIRQQGKCEATIAAALFAVGHIYKFAACRVGFTGMDPITRILSSEWPQGLAGHTPADLRA
jgi:hypothetical protein